MADSEEHFETHGTGAARSATKRKARHVRAAALDGTTRPVGSLVRRAVFEAGQTADTLRADAEREAEAILAEARREAERIRREAAESAHALAGNEVARLIELLEATRAGLCHHAEGELIDLAVAVAERVLQRELEMNRSVVAEIAASALLKVRDQPLIVVYANPRDIEHLNECETELADLLVEGSAIEFRPDETVGPGGCRVETAAGRIEAGLESQLAILRRAMRAAHASDTQDGSAEPEPS